MKLLRNEFPLNVKYLPLKMLHKLQISTNYVLPKKISRKMITFLVSLFWAKLKNIGLKTLVSELIILF